MSNLDLIAQAPIKHLSCLFGCYRIKNRNPKSKHAPCVTYRLVRLAVSMVAETRVASLRLVIFSRLLGGLLHRLISPFLHVR